ncbi:MAG: hypothetical protein II224_03815, partial [Ruminococcus sp.]|nr:hypothetical protein [Ruminococcus sp.]
IITNYLYKFLCMLFNRFPNLNHRSQKLFTRIRQIRQLPLHFPKNCVRIRQTCISMRRVPRVQRAFGEKALYYHSAKRRVKTRIDRLLKKIQPFSPHNQASNAPLERRLCIFTQLNGASKNRDRPSAQTNTAIRTSRLNAIHAVGKTAVYFNPTEWRVKTRTVIDLKPTQPFSHHSQTSNAPLMTLSSNRTKAKGAESAHRHRRLLRLRRYIKKSVAVN